MDADEINKTFGAIIQDYRLKNNLTQEKFAELTSKSSKTISQIETGKDGTSKKTDIEIMNILGIMPNTLYKDFITNPELIKKLELTDKINKLSPEKTKALMEIADIIDNIMS